MPLLPRLLEGRRRAAKADAGVQALKAVLGESHVTILPVDAAGRTLATAFDGSNQQVAELIMYTIATP